MGFGGKRRGATGRHGRPWARRRKLEATRPQRRIIRAAYTLDLIQPVTPFPEYAALVAEVEKAINEMMLGKTLAMGLGASMAPTFGYDWAGKMGREAAEEFALGIATPPRCPAAVALPDTGPDLTALVCTLPAGHDDWHLDVTGARWREDGSGVIVQPVAMLPIITTEVRVKV